MAKAKFLANYDGGVPDSAILGRPGGRSGRVVAAIYTAVGELVGEGSERITFPVVADRAGVNPTTLYRRWPDIGTLLEEVAVAALTRDGESAPDTGSLSQDLSDWAVAIADDIARPERVRYLRAMVAARGEVLAACPVTDTREVQAAEVVHRAQARGESTPTVRQILDHVIAPLYHHAVFGLEIDEDYPRELARDVLAMAR